MLLILSLNGMDILFLDVRIVSSKTEVVYQRLECGILTNLTIYYYYYLKSPAGPMNP